MRDYGTATWEGGDPNCDHTAIRRGHGEHEKQATSAGTSRDRISGEDCRKCGAVRVDLQLGLEPTPEAYVANMVGVFREVRRVLRDDGTLWLNIGDSYAGSWGNYGGGNRGNGKQRAINGGSQIPNPAYDGLEAWRPPTASVPGIKPKDLVGIPWQLAFALRADGWYLRSEIIWAKPNPMPESVTDRPTKSHEQVFLLAKSGRYFFDAEAVKEPQSEGTFERFGMNGRRTGSGPKQANSPNGLVRDKATCAEAILPNGRNIRSVWTIATAPYPKAHFATFPPALAERCILAGTSAEGCCGACGAPWERVVERSGQIWKAENPDKTTGWRPTCECGAETVPCTVLDPFAGSGTSLYVARQNGCNSVGIELNEAYCRLVIDRLKQRVLV